MQNCRTPQVRDRWYSLYMMAHHYTTCNNTSITSNNISTTL